MNLIAILELIFPGIYAIYNGYMSALFLFFVGVAVFSLGWLLLNAELTDLKLKP
jgi:hypothetical protein